MDEQKLPKGTQIPGSKYYRDYCTRCEEPLRIAYSRLDLTNYCERCSPREVGEFGSTLSARQRTVLFRQSNKDI